METPEKIYINDNFNNYFSSKSMLNGFVYDVEYIRADISKLFAEWIGQSKWVYYPRTPIWWDGATCYKSTSELLESQSFTDFLTSRKAQNK